MGYVCPLPQYEPHLDTGEDHLTFTFLTQSIEVVQNHFRFLPQFLNTNTKIEIEYSVVWDVLFSYNHDGYRGLRIKHDFNRYFSSILRGIRERMEVINKFNEKTHYLSPNRGNQKRVLMNQSDKEIDSIILEFAMRNYINKEFIEKCFELLGIEGTLEVNRYENTISTVYLEKGNQKIALADLGFGYSQIIPIILKVHNLIPDKDVKKKIGRIGRIDDSSILGTLILEEPEANLHPNLQSKLADTLAFIKNSLNIKFIIETHSEYFIRKLQYLTAKNELKTDDSVIYYFNDDKYVTNKEPKIKEIFINEEGGLTDSFGPGFFDEATKLQFDLIRLQKQQMN
jgi:hypothetical protein